MVKTYCNYCQMKTEYHQSKIPLKLQGAYRGTIRSFFGIQCVCVQCLKLVYPANIRKHNQRQLEKAFREQKIWLANIPHITDSTTLGEVIEQLHLAQFAMTDRFTIHKALPKLPAYIIVKNHWEIWITTENLGTVSFVAGTYEHGYGLKFKSIYDIPLGTPLSELAPIVSQLHTQI